MSASQLTIDSMLKARELEINVAERAVDAIARAGLIDEPEIASDSPSWVGQLMWQLSQMEKRAAEDVDRLQRILSKLTHVPVERVHEEVAAYGAEAKHAAVTANVAKRRQPRQTAATPEPLVHKKLTDRQRDLLSSVEVASNVANYAKDERVPDWAELKKVMLAIGSKWVSRKGFVFPEDIDGAEQVRVAQLSGEIIDWDGVGFFPTPDALADQLVAMINDLPPGDGQVFLEPSAGDGQLVKAIRRRFPSARILACELVTKNRNALERLDVDLVGDDFLKLTEREIGEPVSVIVANPPFAKRADVHHITRMIELLPKGGQLVAIASAGVKYRDDKLAQDFRALLESHGAVVEDNGEGAFSESGTMVRTVRIWLEKRS